MKNVSHNFSKIFNKRAYLFNSLSFMRKPFRAAWIKIIPKFTNAFKKDL